ncbi:CynX/NimT family MFS transporter [Paeniglutamicibacter kerguelensis]|uniref:CP family cyanate transporter-like MFS transporter n=1 Tax=Paeniglutamicibacter kerguelensis TaxID=254788 RepID=A0ABS4XG23_9MICC|nr:MFS transporter [Paeniglutamicibacter kerguelensis]MBP2387407.1 CP family cyanate transporter-like MFS transporter [Paeniglutamicibacter kerguelensis]
MPLTPPRQKMAGRIGALLGILLMALSLRAAVVSVPPLLGSIGPELGFDSFSTGLLAMLAPIVFAAFGLLTPRLIRWWGLEKILITAVLLAITGQLLRAAVGDVASFLLLSVITLAGYGMGNVVLPPLVKKYFPDRLAIVTSGYVTMLAVGTWMSPQFSVPLANATNWRSSIAAWALLSAIVLVPWTIQIFKDRKHPRPDTPLVNGMVAAPPAKINPWRSPVAWGLAIFLAGNSAQTYVYFTWLPPYLASQGLDTMTAGSMLALFAILGLPVSLLVPLWVPRLRNPIIAVLVFTSFWITGHLGLYLSPTQGTAIWVVFAGLGQGTFAIALLMMNLRSRTTYGSGVLSGFSQGLGYAGAAIVPMLFGMVKDATGGWSASFAMLGICIAVMLTGAVMINGPRKIEDGPDDAGVRRPLERVG